MALRILIVDDNTKKISPLIRAIVDLEVDRANVHVATSAADAKEKLEARTYDLMVLDLLLPELIESDPSIETSLSLLDDISSCEDLHKPRHIIVFSAFSSHIEEVRSRSELRLWSFFHFSETTDDWLIGIINCVKFLLREEENNAGTAPAEQIDICVMTALFKPELQAVLALPWNWKEPEPLDHSTMIQRGHFTADGKTYNVIAAHSLRMGMVASSLLAAKLINLCSPRFLVMTGICAGVREKANFGDVILANPSWDYQSGKHTSNDGGSQFFIAPHQIHVNQSVEAKLLNLSHDPAVLQAIRDSWQGARPETALQALSGPLACGSAVLADRSKIEEILRQNRSLLGIEMEVYGVYSAAQSASLSPPITFALKSVCDFADDAKDDRFQHFAAYTSAQLMRIFFERHISQFPA